MQNSMSSRLFIVAAFLVGGAGLLLITTFNIEIDDSMFLIGVSVIALLILVVAIFKKKTIPESSTHGSAEWANDSDIEKLLVDYDQEPAPGSLILGSSPSQTKRIDLPVDLMLCHTAVVGPTGVGKGRGFFLWALSHFKGSFVYSDPKSEGWKETSGFLENAGHKAWRFAPTDPDNSCHFNWIPLCGKNPTLCYLLALAVVTARYPGADLFFIENQTIIVSALFAHASTFENPTPASLYKFVCSYKGEDFLQLVLNSKNEHARGFAIIFCSASEKLRGNILMGAASTLNFLADERVQRFTSSSTEGISFHILRKEIVGVYLCLEEGDVAALKPLSTLFFTLCFYQLKEEKLDFSYASIKQVIDSTRQNPYLRKFMASILADYCKRYFYQQYEKLASMVATAKMPEVLPVCLLIDEVGNIGKIPNLETEIGIVRGRGIGIVFGLQTRPQLPSVYGNYEGETIWNNCNTKIYLNALDPETSEGVSKALGDTTVVEEEVSISEKKTGFFSKDVTKTTRMAKVKRRLMTAEEVRQIGEDEQIIISRNLKPIYSKRFWYTAKGAPATANKLGPALVEKFGNSASSSPAQQSNMGLPNSQNGTLSHHTNTQAQITQPAPKLTLTLIPESAKVQKLRQILDKEIWELLKIKVNKLAKNKCEICEIRGENIPLRVFDEWHFDDSNNKQKLVAIISLCPDCFEAKNMLSAFKNKTATSRVAHLAKINGWSNDQAISYLKDALQTWNRRNNSPWIIEPRYIDAMFDELEITGYTLPKMNEAYQTK